MNTFAELHRPLNEDEIAEACRLVIAYEIATTKPDETHVFHSSYITAMQDLRNKIEDETIEPARVRMGWQYYARKGLAAVLIGALLAGVAMPERVMAGYKWLIRIMEELFTDRTEYRYTSDVSENVEFVQMKFGYLPENMELKNEEKENEYIKLVFSKENVQAPHYFMISQSILTETRRRLFGTNLEIYATEIIAINGELIEISLRENIIYFTWIHDVWHISGQTDLPKNELLNILTNIQFE